MRAVLATLLDRFHCSLAEIACLTDRQIVDLYFHKRDPKSGQIELPGRAVEPETKPDETPTLASGLRDIQVLAGTAHLKPEVVAQLRADLYRKFGETPPAGLSGAG